MAFEGDSTICTTVTPSNGISPVNPLVVKNYICFGDDAVDEVAFHTNEATTIPHLNDDSKRQQKEPQQKDHHPSSSSFPPSQFLVKIMEQENVAFDDVDSNIAEKRTGTGTRNFLLPQNNPRYYERLIRKALLLKYGLLDIDHLARVRGNKSLSQDESRRKDEAMDNEYNEDASIDFLWDSLRVFRSGVETTKDDSFQLAGVLYERAMQAVELIEFVNSNGTISNNTKLRWSTLRCQPGCQFHLHSHPTMEIIICLEGELHEVRMNGEPVPIVGNKKQQIYNDTTIASPTTEENAKDIHHGTTSTSATPKPPSENGSASTGSLGSSPIEGPDLSYIKRSWSFRTLRTGQCLINEVGSVHKSFTSTAGSGCLLLVLWCGYHANIEYEPKCVDISKAVQQMDQKITDFLVGDGRGNDVDGADGCLGCTTNNADKWDRISETFLPDSEKMNKICSGY